MARSYAHEEITAPLWDEVPPGRRIEPRAHHRDELLLPRPIAIASEITADQPAVTVPPWLEEVMHEPAIVVVVACVFGLAATAIAGLVGFLIGVVVG